MSRKVYIFGEGALIKNSFGVRFEMLKSGVMEAKELTSSELTKEYLRQTRQLQPKKGEERAEPNLYYTAKEKHVLSKLAVSSGSQSISREAQKGGLSEPIFTEKVHTGVRVYNNDRKLVYIHSVYPDTHKTKVRCAFPLGDPTELAYGVYISESGIVIELNESQLLAEYQSKAYNLTLEPPVFRPLYISEKGCTSLNSPSCFYQLH